MDIGEIIMKNRHRHCLTQKELAKRVGITPMSLCSIEKNKSVPRANTFLKIVKEIDLKFEDFEEVGKELKK